MMAVGKIGPALAAGNTSIIKPARMTPLTTLRLAELAADILPPGVLNVVTGDGLVVGDALVRHPGCDSSRSPETPPPARRSPRPPQEQSSGAP